MHGGRYAAKGNKCTCGSSKRQQVPCVHVKISRKPYKGDERETPYNIISGTSMACRHAAGAPAYVKSLHSNWSSTAIKSALLIIATPMSSALNLEEEFAYGTWSN